LINFRYHIVSLIAVFLALAIGVIMGSAVIDRAIVNRLEDQQRGLEGRLKDIESENDTLQSENRALGDTANKLADQGSQRLLAGALAGVPVLVVADRGVESSGFDDLLSLLRTSGAEDRGTLWLTERFELKSDDEVNDLAAALDAPATMSPDALRTLALTRLATYLRAGAGPAVPSDQSGTTTTTTTAETSGAVVEGGSADVFASLRDAGFLDFDVPEGSSTDAQPDLTPGTRLVVVSGEKAKVAPELVSIPFSDLLASERPGVPSVALLAAEDRADKPEEEFTVPLRRNKDVSERLSTVDNIGDFAGRLAAVLAIVDLGEGHTGHYGTGPGAQRLLPAPTEK